MIISILLFIASIGVIVFAIIYSKKKDRLYSFRPNDKQKIKGKKRNIKTIWGREDINNSMITGHNRNTIIIEIGSIEYKLLNKNEQSTIDDTLISLAKIFKLQTEFFSTVEKIDTTKKIEDIRKNLDRQTNIKIKEYGESIIEYLEDIMHEDNLFVRKNYIIATSNEPYKQAYDELILFYKSLKSSLMSIKINIKLLNDGEIIELLHRELNKNSTEKINSIIKEGGLDIFVKGKEKGEESIA